jgi:hypothetical protein
MVFAVFAVDGSAAFVEAARKNGVTAQTNAGAARRLLG